MAATQVTAGIALLKKVLPDLQAMTITGEGGGPVKIQRIEWQVLDPEAEDSEGV